MKQNSTLADILAQYRNGERGLPTYEELLPFATPAATSGDAPTELQRLKADEHGEFLSMQAVMKIRNGIKPGDGWGGDEWDYALANAVADRLARIERAAAPATASGDDLPKPAAWIDDFGNVWPLGAYSPTGKPSYLDADKRGWKPLYRAAVSAATKPAPIDLSSLERYDVEEFIDGGAEMEAIENGPWVRFVDVEHLLATKPAAQTVPGFAERDPSKPAEQQGMFRKFDVRRVDGSDQPGGKHYGCRYYVLDLTHDQHAPAAMRAYAASCRATHPKLADDIESEFDATNPGVPEGFALVPIKYTREMRAAWDRAPQSEDDDRDFAGAYAAMLAAAPAATPAAQDQADQSHVLPPFAAPASQREADPSTPDEIDFLTEWLQFIGEPVGVECCGRGYGDGECCNNPVPVTATLREVEQAMNERLNELVAKLPASGFREGRNTNNIAQPEIIAAPERSDTPAGEDKRDSARLEKLMQWLIEGRPRSEIHAHGHIERTTREIVLAWLDARIDGDNQGAAEGASKP